jgi:DNA polymerase delta subunit 1
LTFKAPKTNHQDLLQNRLDLSLLVISKAISKEGNAYTSKQAHVELAERMKKRYQGREHEG